MYVVRRITSVAGLAALVVTGAGCRSGATQKRPPAQAKGTESTEGAQADGGGVQTEGKGDDAEAVAPPTDPLAPRTEALGDGMKRFHALGVAMDYPKGWSLQARKIEAEDRVVLHIETVMPDRSAAAIDITLDADIAPDLDRIAAYYPRRMGGTNGKPKHVGTPTATLLGARVEGRATRLSPREPANPELDEVRIEAYAGRGDGLTVEAAFITADVELGSEASADVRAQFVAALGTIARRAPDAP